MQPRPSALKVHLPGQDVPEKDAAPNRADEALAGRFVAALQQQIGEKNYRHWFEDKTSIRINGDSLAVGVGSPFLLNWMQKSFRPAVTAAAQVALGPSAQAFFEVDSGVQLVQAAGAKVPAPATASAETAPASAAKAPTVAPLRNADSSAKPVQRTGRKFSSLNDFVEGACNELALAAAKQVGNAPGERINPLYLYGGVGTGKTHLLEGIYKAARDKFPQMKVVFLTAEAFANYFTEALRAHTLPSFRQRFRGVDVLLVDDIDFLNGKKGIQEEFLHTFQQLESHDRQIVVTSDCHPRLLTKLCEELTTRFMAGLVCRLEAPDTETRQNILRAKAGLMGVELNEGVLDYVAGKFRNNVRELEGALNCLATQQSVTNKQISQNLAKKILSDLEHDCVRVIRMGDIEETVCQFFGVEAEELKSAKRTRAVTQPRTLAMFLARKHTHAAYSEIGRYFGGRNHSTVVSAEKRVQSWLDDEAEMKVASRKWRVGELLETLEQQMEAS